MGECVEEDVSVDIFYITSLGALNYWEEGEVIILVNLEIWKVEERKVEVLV